MMKLQVKTMLITSFSIRGSAHFEFIPQGQAVSQAYHIEIFTRLHAAVQTKSSELWTSSLFVNYGSASANRAQCEALYGQKNLAGLEHCRYLPDLAPNYFWLISKLKFILKGEGF
jgi:hypothetical protein